MTELFTEDQLEEFKNNFTLFEKDENHISVKDLGNLLRSLGQHPTEADLEDHCNNFDSDGTIEFNDFLRIMARTIKDTDPESELSEAFKVLDKDAAGNIKCSKLRHFMTTYGEVLSAEEVDEMIKEADTDGDGIIDYEEFIGILLAH